MEEYKRIIKTLSVPSFYALILAVSIILITYYLYIESPEYAVTGIILLAVSFVIFFKFTIIKNKKIEAGEIQQDKVPAIKFGAIIIDFIIPLIISFAVIVRIISLMNFQPIDNKSEIFTAEVQGARMLQYSNETEFNFTDNLSVNRAVGYISKHTELNPGDKIEIYKKPAELDLKTGDSFYSKTLIRKGIKYVFYLNDSKDYKIIYKAPLNLKEKIRRAIEKNINSIFDSRTAPVIKALYFGNKNFLDKATILDFKRSGTLHILAASGLHLGIIASMIFFSFFVFRINKRILMLITLLAVSFYLYITDTPVSLLRAYMMFLIFSIQYIFNLEKNIVNTLLLSGISILVIYPYDLFDLGFQLSFGATLGILLFYRFYRSAFSSLPKYVSNTMAVTVSAQVMVLPVILFQLGEINLTGVLSNLILIPGMSLTLVLSVVSNLLTPVSTAVAKIAAFLTDIVYQANLHVVVFFSKINGHFYYNGNGYGLIPPYICGLAPLFPLKQIKRYSLYIFMTGFIFSWALLLNFSIPESRQIAVLQKEKTSVLIYKDGDKASIIGNCETKSHADALTRYILNNNIRYIELSIPHPDCNSLKNFSYFIKKNIVKRCVISPDAISNFYFKKFCEIVDNDGIKMEIKDFKDVEKPLKEGDKNNPEEIYILYDMMMRGELKQIKIRYPVKIL